jgi:hypothetical protein
MWVKKNRHFTCSRTQAAELKFQKCQEMYHINRIKNENAEKELIFIQ